MKITVTNTQEDCLILFDSSLGVGAGKWVSKIPPNKGEVYDIEFDTDRSLVDLNVEKNSHPVGIKLEKGETVFNGIIEAIDDDGMVIIRMSKDCLMMIEAGGKGFARGEAIELKFNPCFLEISAIDS